MPAAGAVCRAPPPPRSKRTTQFALQRMWATQPLASGTGRSTLNSRSLRSVCPTQGQELPCLQAGPLCGCKGPGTVTRCPAAAPRSLSAQTLILELRIVGPEAKAAGRTRRTVLLPVSRCELGETISETNLNTWLFQFPGSASPWILAAIDRLKCSPCGMATPHRARGSVLLGHRIPGGCPQRTAK